MVAEGKIELPPIQRGFVWKPYQIENLWDSLLRGFPIGCFICKKNSDGVIEILDGQQRLTSILLGLNWKEYSLNDDNYAKRIYDMQQKEIKIFLDLKENTPDNIDHRKYNTRIITKFHPWGYQKSPNKQILNYENIRKAKTAIYNGIDENKSKEDKVDKDRLKVIKNENEIFDVYTDEANLNIFFKHGFPYDSNDKKDCVLLKDSLQKEYENTYFMYEDEKKDKKKVSELYQKVLERKIPFVYIDEEGQTDYIPKDIQRNNEDNNTEKDLDSTEYLFTLINRGGTRVSNDDLNFSLIKSKLMQDNNNSGRNTIEDINQACKLVGIYPARFITICYFLYKTEMNKEKNKNGISLYVSPTEFRQMLQKDTENKFLSAITPNNKEIKYPVSLIEDAKKLMVYNKENTQGIPYIWFLTIIQRYTPLAFLMLYLIQTYRKEVLKENIIKIITILYLFDYKKYQRNPLRKLVEKFVEYSEMEKNEDINKRDLSLVTKKFWKDETVKNIMTLPFSSLSKDDELEYVKNSRALLLYAQREYLAKEFTDDKFIIDDMNIPFDYDHIFPQCYKGNSNNKYWDSIGNLRAWPYYKNRQDGKKLPYEKFTDEDYENSFCNKNITKRIEDVKNIDDGYEGKKVAANIIRDRLISIYKEWYETLNIRAFLENNEEHQ